MSLVHKQSCVSCRAQLGSRARAAPAGSAQLCPQCQQQNILFPKALQVKPSIPQSLNPPLPQEQCVPHHHPRTGTHHTAAPCTPNTALTCLHRDSFSQFFFSLFSPRRMSCWCSLCQALAHLIAALPLATVMLSATITGTSRAPGMGPTPWLRSQGSGSLGKGEKGKVFFREEQHTESSW